MSNFTKRRWTEDDDRILREQMPLIGAMEVAKLLGRSRTSIYQRSDRLGVAGCVRKWTSKEVAFIRDHPNLTAREIGERLGRSTGAVQIAVQRYKIPRGYFWTDEDRKEVERAVARTIEELRETLGRGPTAIRRAISAAALRAEQQSRRQGARA